MSVDLRVVLLGSAFILERRLLFGPGARSDRHCASAHRTLGRLVFELAVVRDVKFRDEVGSYATEFSHSDGHPKHSCAANPRERMLHMLCCTGGRGGGGGARVRCAGGISTLVSVERVLSICF